MSKRKIVRALLMSAFALATLCLFSTAVSAQKGPQSTEGAPLKGVDVKLGKNPGGSAAARTIETDKDGKFHAGILPKGSWYLIVVVPESEAATAQSDDIYLVKIIGAVGGEQTWAWKLQKQGSKDVARKIDAAVISLNQSNSQGRASKPVAQDRIIFDSDGATPCDGAIVKSKSNITNN